MNDHDYLVVDHVSVRSAANKSRERRRQVRMDSDNTLLVSVRLDGASTQSSSIHQPTAATRQADTIQAATRQEVTREEATREAATRRAATRQATALQAATRQAASRRMEAYKSCVSAAETAIALASNIRAPLRAAGIRKRYMYDDLTSVKVKLRRTLCEIKEQQRIHLHETNKRFVYCN
jgi:hypothetical protein